MIEDISPQKKEIMIDGHQVWFRVTGAGIPLIILAGWGGSTDKYFPLQDRLGILGYRVILPDLPGLPGKSVPVRMSVNKWAAWIHGLANATVGRSFVIVSHSLSARIAVEYLTLQDSHCKGSVFVDPWLIGSKCRASLYHSLAQVLRFLCPVVYPDMNWVKDNKAWSTALNLISATDWRPSAPCLILWGKRDPARLLFSEWKQFYCDVRKYDWDHSPQVRATEELAIAIDEFVHTVC